jgi:nitrous oxidase accessory protein NosD
MRRLVLPLALAIITVPLLHATAQAAPRPKSPPPPTPPPATPQMRTYVSGLGSDANPCLASWPCQTFQAALALTIAGGEIYVLDSANYGPVTINKAVTITSEGAVAGVLATSGAGITIAAGGGDVVNLRGLDVDGAGAGSIGIQFSSGQSLNIQKSVVRNFSDSGISFAPNGASTLFITDSTVTNTANNGVSVTSNGSR